MLKITKSGLKLHDLPYTVNEPFMCVLNVTDTYKGVLNVNAKYYDKIDTELKDPIQLECIMQGQGFYQTFAYDRKVDGVDALSFAHTKMKEFLLTLKADLQDQESENIFTDSEIEIINL